LREPARVDAIVGALRQAVTVPFTVKTRVGFDSPEVFESLLSIFARHSVDLVTVHGRTVTQMYRPGVRYDLISRAVSTLPCPVLANGNVYSGAQALYVLEQTGARGLMIGRAAIRNPWIFQQVREQRMGLPSRLPTGRDVLGYIEALWESQISVDSPENSQVQRLKKFMNFIGEGIPPAVNFLHEIRRTQTRDDFFRVCAAYLDHDESMSLEPAEVQVSPPLQNLEPVAQSAV
jgi:tRNA-dihydrouridine synthase